MKLYFIRFTSKVKGTWDYPKYPDTLEEIKKLAKYSKRVNRRFNDLQEVLNHRDLTHDEWNELDNLWDMDDYENNVIFDNLEIVEFN